MIANVRPRPLPRPLANTLRQTACRGLSRAAVDRLRPWLIAQAGRGCGRSGEAGTIDWRAVADAHGVAPAALLAAAPALQAALERVWRANGARPAEPCLPAMAVADLAACAPHPMDVAPAAAPEGSRQAFAAALAAQMGRHGESVRSLCRAMWAQGLNPHPKTLYRWLRAERTPSRPASVAILAWLEARWGLPVGDFQAQLPNPDVVAPHRLAPGLNPADRPWLSWHLPADFQTRPATERAEILAWIGRVVTSGASDYGRYVAKARRHPFAVRLPGDTVLEGASRRVRGPLAPPGLAAECADLVAFKTASLPPVGFERQGRWGAAAVSHNLKALRLLLGALCAPTAGPVAGYGLSPARLSLGLLVFPRIWDWHLRWRQQRRGFLTVGELNLLQLAVGLTQAGTGWMTQTPSLALAIQPVEGLISPADIAQVGADWPGACAAVNRFCRSRAAEVKAIAQIHRDPFEPILPVLEAANPLGEYRKIADEIRRQRSCGPRHPRLAAESVRDYLLIRLGLHLGWRQRNLRELRLCARGATPQSDRQLTAQGCGELRWHGPAGVWEVYAPASAFKNAGSRYFAGRPFRLLLPDLAGLQAEIDAYVATHRSQLLGAAPDPGLFFVRANGSGGGGGFNQRTFYGAWRAIILRYGVYNPYTGRGAIAGLLPHGPHSLRDVLATHMLKQTGSYEQAAYAIQDTAQTIARHYGRFEPRDKAALAAAVLNRAWEAEA